MPRRKYAWNSTPYVLNAQSDRTFLTDAAGPERHALCQAGIHPPELADRHPAAHGQEDGA